MKYFFGTICVCLSLTVKSQEPTQHMIDSILAIPQTIELKISSPQPRLKEKIELSLNMNYVRAQIFRSAIGKFETAEDIGNIDQDFMVMKVNALQKGKQSIGPLSFNLNGTTYTTNKLEYEVIDALPDTDNGVWIRKAFPNDSTLCIIVEQRIPANSRVTKIDENTTKYWTEPTGSNIAMMNTNNSVDGLEYHTSTSYSEEGYFYNEKKKRIQFLSGYFISYFSITDKHAKIKLTKENFKNLPADYKFEDIIIQ